MKNNRDWVNDDDSDEAGRIIIMGRRKAEEEEEEEEEEEPQLTSGRTGLWARSGGGGERAQSPAGPASGHARTEERRFSLLQGRPRSRRVSWASCSSLQQE